MKEISLWLDILGISVSALMILRGKGNFGDYWFVLGWLFFCVADLVIRRIKKRRD
jgi:hypothetical protein